MEVTMKFSIKTQHHGVYIAHRTQRRRQAVSLLTSCIGWQTVLQKLLQPNQGDAQQNIEP